MEADDLKITVEVSAIKLWIFFRRLMPLPESRFSNLSRIDLLVKPIEPESTFYLWRCGRQWSQGELAYAGYPITVADTLRSSLKQNPCRRYPAR